MALQQPLLETVARDVRYAFRSFGRAPLAALTIVATVGLGLGLVAVVFTILNAYVFRMDEVRNPSELFAVERRQPGSAEPEPFTRRQFETLVREAEVFSAAVARTRDLPAWIEGTRREGRLVTGNFFQVLGAVAARGRALTPSDDEPGRPPVIVLSHRAWVQHYASDPGVLDRPIRVNGTSYDVIGVMSEGFRGLEPVAAPDFWAPLALVEQFRPGQHAGDGANGLENGLEIIGRLKPGLSRAQALAQLLVWDSRNAAERSGDRPATILALEPRSGTVALSVDVMLLFMPLFFAFGLILMIGCANVANLLLARGVARQREIGIRLAIGASRRRVVWQLLTESLLLALICAAVAFGISRLVLVGVAYAAITTFPPEIGNIRVAVPPADWRVGLFLLSGAMVSTLFFALAPALQATRLELVRAIRGEIVRDARPGRARDALLVVQVTGSVLLLICAAVFLRSSWAAASVDPGIRTAGIIDIRVLNEQRRGAILDVVKNDPQIASVAASLPGILGGSPALASSGASGKSAVTYQFVSPEYFAVLDIDLVRGRGFTDNERSADVAVAVVSESVARQLWPRSDAIGQVVQLERDPSRRSGAEELGGPRGQDLQPPSRNLAVVGVARDVPGFRLGGFRMAGAGVYVPIATETAGTTLIMQARANAERARHDLVDRLAFIDPNVAEVETLQTIASAESYLLAVPFWLTLVLGGLALLLTLSGLFSVLSYLVEQRTREIGVRMALGATRGSVAALVLRQSARPVGVGMALGAGLTAALAGVLLATPAAEQIGSTVHLLDPVAYAASLLCSVAACTCAALIPALRAGRIDPIGALRQD